MIGRRGYVPLRRLDDITLRHSWVVDVRLVWDVVEMYWCSNKTSWRCTTETFWQRSTETSMDVSFKMYLWRRWDIKGDVIMMSPRRLVADWEDCVAKKEKCLVFYFYYYNSVTLLLFQLSLLFLSTSAIISSRTIAILRFLFRLYSSIFL